MTLAVGTKLGPYEILSQLGAGGMGEVYKARDTRLERMVAVKVLSARLSSSPELRQRFELEARTISQLSHPHICALYDVGREGDVEYLVMELLEGETLSARLVKGAVNPDQVLRYGIEIADALDKAHRQGIVHRDLKPANVMLTKSGVKLLDFGLAKAMAPPAERGSLTSLPTQQGLTQEGTILGTFQYMAPEQLEGKEADARTDIFALGAVIYETATGRKAFTGASQASLISSIMTAEPVSISASQPMSPQALDRVVKTCLAKDPEDRWQSAGDVAKELKWIAEGSAAGVAAPGIVAGPRRSHQLLAWGTAGLLGLAALALAVILVRLRTEAAGRLLVRLSVLPPDKTSFSSLGSGGPVAVSPDGRILAFTAVGAEGTPLLYVRPLSAVAAQPLSGTEGASFPFWSPDSRLVGFFARGKLKRVDASGGPVTAVCDAAEGRGGTWNRDGDILFANRYSPIYRVRATGGRPIEVTQLDPKRGDTTHRWPQFLPDGHHFLYLAAPLGMQSESNTIFVASLDGKENREILPASSNVAYASGHLLYTREGALVAQPFDPRGLRVQGDAVPVVEGVSYDYLYSHAVFSVSEDGILVYQAGGEADTRLAWLDRGGKTLGFVDEASFYASPRLSPDGKRIAVAISEPNASKANIWIYDVERGTRSRFTFAPARETFPVWSPDGVWLVYGSSARGPFGLYRKRSDGTGPEELLLQTQNSTLPSSFSPDGNLLAFDAFGGPQRAKTGILILPLTGDRKPYAFLQTPANAGNAQFSPDGKWIAYVSDESGRSEVYVTGFPRPEGKWQVSSAGGQQPRWTRDGKELFYLEGRNGLMVVDMKTEGGFQAGQPRKLFPVRPLFGGLYDLAPDGRILVNTPQGEQATEPITVILNWTSDLKK
jgi:Tol biopolymer transport system component